MMEVTVEFDYQSSADMIRFDRDTSGIQRPLATWVLAGISHMLRDHRLN